MLTNDNIHAEKVRQLLAFTWENLGPSRFYAEMAQGYAEHGDLIGLQYSIACFAAHARATVKTANELRALCASNDGGEQ